jgi:hypothetical protein
MDTTMAYMQTYAGGMGGGGGGGGGSRGGLENPDQFNTGVSGEDLQAAANRYAAGRSYNGAPYVPHMVMQEGTVTYRNGQPGVMIKYSTPSGDSTEWTPIG